MAWEFRYEVDEDPCETCAGAVLIESKREGNGRGRSVPWTPIKAWCTRCYVVVRDTEARIRCYIAKQGQVIDG
jgi:hypothetical protein